jgi:hypothetical protein
MMVFRLLQEATYTGNDSTTTTGDSKKKKWGIPRFDQSTLHPSECQNTTQQAGTTFKADTTAVSIQQKATTSNAQQSTTSHSINKKHAYTTSIDRFCNTE